MNRGAARGARPRCFLVADTIVRIGAVASSYFAAGNIHPAAGLNPFWTPAMRWSGMLLLPVLILLVGLAVGAEKQGPAPAKPPRPVFFLGRGLGWAINIDNQIDCSQLRREYVRQALLMAAREELGWQAQDAWLGDRPAAGNSVYLLDAVPVAGSPNTVDILTGVQPQQRRREIVVLPAEATHDDGSEIALFESLSRQRFPQLLQRVTGAGPEARPGWGAVDLPAAVEEQLEQMAFFSQFAAVRTIHAEIAQRGESPALVGGLIRGYAQLGLLTEGLWSPSFRTYHARALLYAQRWQVREPNSPQPLWHRALAEATAGFPGRAIQDLAAADKLAAAPTGQPIKPPAWVGIVRGFVEFDLRGLAVANDQPHAQLAAVLLFIARQQAGSPVLAIRQGTTLLAWMDQCERIQNDLARLSDTPLEQEITSRAPRQFAVTLYHNVSLLPGCPAAAAAISDSRFYQQKPLTDDEVPDEQQDRLKLIAALYAAGQSGGEKSDGGAAVPLAEDRNNKPTVSPTPADARTDVRDAAEPGWGALANWIEETTFLHAFRRAQFLANDIHEDPSEYIGFIRPLVEHHRFFAAINLLRFDPAAKKAAADTLNGISLYGLDTRQRYLADAFYGVDPRRCVQTWLDLTAPMDRTANDVALLTWQWKSKYLEPYAEWWLQLSPRNPQALGILIGSRSNPYKDKADQYATLAEQHPYLARALADRYFASKQYAKSETFYALAVKLEPTLTYYRELAYFYRLRGDLDRFQRTLEKYVATEPDVNLDHAQAIVCIVACYTKRGLWEKAAPFARQAAESGAAFTLLGYAVVCEHLNKFDEANQLYRADADSYGDSGALYWLCFSLRTGRGNEPEARRRWERYRRQNPNGPGPNGIEGYAVVDLLDGKDDSALEIFQRDFERSNNPWMGLCAALAADRLGKTALRDQLLDEVRQRGAKFAEPLDGRPRQSLIDLADLLADNLKHDGRPALDLAAAERICQRGKFEQIQLAAYLVGDYLWKHGKLEDAERFWMHALDDLSWGQAQTEVPAFRLKQAGIKAEDLDAARKKLGLKDRWYTD